GGRGGGAGGRGGGGGRGRSGGRGDGRAPPQRPRRRSGKVLAGRRRGAARRRPDSGGGDRRADARPHRDQAMRRLLGLILALAIIAGLVTVAAFFAEKPGPGHIVWGHLRADPPLAPSVARPA